MRISYLFFTLLFAVCITQAQDLSNPDFEILNEESFPENWKAGKQPFDVLSDRNEKVSGDYSIVLRDQGKGGYGTFSQSLSFTVDKVKKYRLTGYIKTDSVAGGFAGLWVSTYADKKLLFFDNMRLRGVKGTTDWQKYTTEFFVDQRITKINIGGLMAGEGQAWFDNYQLEEVNIEKREPSPEIISYLGEVKKIMQDHALRRDSVDFDIMMNMAHVMAAEAKEPKDAYPVIRYMLNNLGDNHSFLLEAKRAEAWANTSTADQGKPVAIPQATGKIVGNPSGSHFGYISMPGVSSGDPNTLKDFADSLQNLIRHLDADDADGWILDLRKNTGGNCWPMLAGIGPVLGKGTSGYFMNVNGAKNSWGYKKGASRSGRFKITKISGKPYKFPEKFVPVAVLTGPSTASSGEVVTVSFCNRPNTKSFGQPTAGLSTGNRQFTLSDDAKVFLTSSVYADRTEHQYGHKIEPDQMVEFTREEIGTEDDPVIKAAIEWLDGLKK